MGREVRRVPEGWEHPTDERGHLIPLHDGQKLGEHFARWIVGKAAWDLGFVDNFQGGWATKSEFEVESPSFEDYAGDAPNPAEYMPAWPPALCTRLMMYEDTTEGTPISPAFETPEELARWLADNGASAFGGMTAGYESWLATINAGWAPGMVFSNGTLTSGVDHMREVPAA